MSSSGYLAAGFVAFWVVLGGYFIFLYRSQKEIQRRIEELEKR